MGTDCVCDGGGGGDEGGVWEEGGGHQGVGEGRRGGEGVTVSNGT